MGVLCTEPDILPVRRDCEPYISCALLRDDTKRERGGIFRAASNSVLRNCQLPPKIYLNWALIMDVGLGQLYHECAPAECNTQPAFPSCVMFDLFGDSCGA